VTKIGRFTATTDCPIGISRAQGPVPRLAALKTGAAAFPSPPSAAAPNFVRLPGAIIDFFALTDENNLFSPRPARL